MYRDVEGHQICVLREASYFQIKADDEHIPGDPEGSPHCIHHDVTWSILNGSKQTQYDNYYMQEISKNGCPLEAEEVKDLPLQS